MRSTPRTDGLTIDTLAPSVFRPDGQGAYVSADFARQLERELTAKDEAIADLNQRLIDRTEGMLATIQSQQLEIAKWKSAHRAVSRELLSSIMQRLDLVDQLAKSSCASTQPTLSAPAMPPASDGRPKT